MSPLRPRLILLAVLTLSAGPALAQDLDGDGWTVADGDCADVASGLVTRPELVNPGAYDDPFNGIDDDCDGQVDNPTPTNCSTVNQLANVTATSLAYAMELCQTTTQNAPLPFKRWGLISALLQRASGSSSPNLVQAAVKQQYGTYVLPVGNGTMAVLSSGTARDASDPGYVAPLPGYVDALSAVSAPADFTTPNGGLYVDPACPDAINTVHDSAKLRLIVRVPTNANGFVFAHRFFSSEYPNTCSQYNDHLLCLLTSSAPGVPANKNVLFDSQANPMTVQTALFENCGPPCNSGDHDLAGTGYGPNGGGTNWSTSAAPVLPGEVITLEFHIWDTMDGQADALALIDNFQWLTMPQDPVTGVGPSRATPGGVRLGASPNPFSSATTVEFALARPGRAVLDVFDVGGRRVRRLAEGAFPAGTERVEWDGRDDSGRRVEPGAYFVHLRSASGTLTQRLVLAD